VRNDSNFTLLTRVALIALFGLTLLGQANSALAAAFNVSPTRITLSAQQTSALLTLTNDSDKTIRFQLSVVAWDQTEDGQMRVTPNNDIVIFPPLVTIAAHESRRIRVGAQVPAGLVEQNYRLFVEELPNEADVAKGTRAIQVRTKMGIPVFLQGPKAVVSTRVENMVAHDGTLDFDLRNSGTAHTVVQTLQVKGLGDNGREVFTSTTTAWYLLAQHRQVFHMPLDAAQCAASKKFVLVATTDDGNVTSTIDVPASACAVRR
jgi:fimbrial chaperone protein